LRQQDLAERPEIAVAVTEGGSEQLRLQVPGLDQRLPEGDALLDALPARSVGDRDRSALGAALGRPPLVLALAQCHRSVLQCPSAYESAGVTPESFGLSSAPALLFWSASSLSTNLFGSSSSNARSISS